jgi:Lon protease-like protein
MIEEVRINFAKPMPIFPLDAVVLFPQQLLPLHIFEPRYRQMIEAVLDGSGQFAMAVLADEGSIKFTSPAHSARPPIRRAVCVGQIMRHERTTDGRYNIFLHGVCRAHIRAEVPHRNDILYREALLAPAETGDAQSAPVVEAKSLVSRLLTTGELAKLRAAETLREWIEEEEMPNSAFFEFLSLALIHDPSKRYKLLAEPDVTRRAEFVTNELVQLERLIRKAREQRPELWPKGCSWN